MYVKRYLFVLLLFVSFLSVIQPVYSDERPEELRQLFRQAEESLRAQRWREYLHYKNELLNYPLIAYLEYAEYKKEPPSVQELERFVIHYPLFPRLGDIKERLLEIYYEDENWSGIIRHTKRGEHPCLRLLAGFHLKHDPYSLRVQAENIWLSGKELDELCVQVLKETNFNFYKDPDMIWRRLVAVYELKNHRLARLLRAYIDPSQLHAYDLWEKLRRSKRRIGSYARQMKDLPPYRDILTHILTHYPQDYVEEGYDHYLRLRKSFTFSVKQHKLIGYYLALHLTINGNPLGLEVMTEIQPTLLEEKEHEWRARSAIKFADWDKLIDFIDDFPPYLARDAAWLFWKGYAFRKKGRYNKSIDLYREAGKQRNFYGFYAAEEAGMPKNFNHKPAVPHRGDTVNHRPSYMRYLELIELGRQTAAIAEWEQTIRNSNFAQLLFLANAAYERGDFYLAIRTFTQAKYWDDLRRRFPLPYRSWVERAAADNHLSAPLIYAIMRTESSFRPHVRSSAGAIGLMQLLPATGREMARKYDYPDGVRLTDPATSIALGTYYLRETLSRYHGNQVLAIASYNAGPTTVRNWLPKKKSIPAIEWLETIPYGETRFYVRSIFFAQTIFQWRLEKRQISMRHFLRDINARY